uniref:Uncharacterized protein n=1 Tax=Anopheles minimus TaxID=112268 RepID=A0A182WMP2_9DIPT
MVYGLWKIENNVNPKRVMWFNQRNLVVAKVCPMHGGMVLVRFGTAV